VRHMRGVLDDLSAVPDAPIREVKGRRDPSASHQHVNGLRTERKLVAVEVSGTGHTRILLVLRGMIDGRSSD
jgi:hypothetical protein